MDGKKRIRRIGSIKYELLKKSREAALAAVQIFNNPNITFKSEIYVVLMHIAWTYLLHAYYRSKKIEYRYFHETDGKRAFDRTKNGAFKYWELERCLNDKSSPIDRDAANNLRFLIGLRHEIEHQMTTCIDDFLSARFQACCLNYNECIVALFGKRYAIDRYLSFSLQFSSLSHEQIELLDNSQDLPSNISKYIAAFDGGMKEEEYKNPKYAYRVLFVPKLVNHKGQADRVIEFVKADSELAQKVNSQYVVLKETERPKSLPTQIVKRIQEKGFPKFTIYHHTLLWQKNSAKTSEKNYGTQVAKTWYWYDRWEEFVFTHCKENNSLYQ